MSVEKMREEFEKAYMASMNTDLPPSVWLERRANGSYASVSTNAAWWGWQVSRVAIDVELPKCEYANEASEYSKGHRQGIRACREAIESLGLKIKQ